MSSSAGGYEAGSQKRSTVSPHFSAAVSVAMDSNKHSINIADRIPPNFLHLKRPEKSGIEERLSALGFKDCEAIRLVRHLDLNPQSVAVEVASKVA